MEIMCSVDACVSVCVCGTVCACKLMTKLFYALEFSNCIYPCANSDIAVYVDCGSGVNEPDKAATGVAAQQCVQCDLQCSASAHTHTHTNMHLCVVYLYLRHAHTQTQIARLSSSVAAW